LGWRAASKIRRAFVDGDDGVVRVVKDHQRTAELRERFPAVGLAEVFEELAPDPETRGRRSTRPPRRHV